MHMVMVMMMMMMRMAASAALRAAPARWGIILIAPKRSDRETISGKFPGNFHSLIV